MTDPLELAHDYVRRGWGVVPLYGIDADKDACRCRAGRTCPPKNRGKHPHGTKAGWRVLTSGPDVQAWFEDHPHDNVGIVTGVESGLFVFDVDGAAGVASVTALATEHGALPATRIVRTGSGGLHYYFRHPGHFKVYDSASYLAAGIDIRGVGGQVVAPPSVSGRGAYELIADHAVAEAPPWLLTLLAEHSAHVEGGRKAEVRTAERVDVEFLPEAVQTLRSTLVGIDEGRHKHFHALVAACFENGYTQGQAVTIAAPWCAAVDKYTGRVEQEVARSWGKLSAEAARAEEWLPGVSGVGASPPTSKSAAVAATAQPVAPSPQPTPESLGQGNVASDAPEDGDGEHDDASALPATWAPVDLEAILDGSYEPERPSMFLRTDGAALVYPGRVHSFHGESESGKSLVAQYEAVRVLAEGGTVAYLDFESDAAAVVGRLLELGATPEQLRTQFEYRRPDTDPRRFATDREHYVEFVSRPWTYVVLDGMTDALGTFGYGTQDNDEIAAFMRFLRRITTRTGAALVIVDHVTKDTESRGRFALGGQAKMNALDGAAYTVEVKEALGRGLRGLVVLRVAKDRPGGVRPGCGAFAKDRTQEAARVWVDSTAGDGIQVSVEPPETMLGEAPKPFRPTGLMERVSQYLELAGEAGSEEIEREVTGKGVNIRSALKVLLDEGYVSAQKVGTKKVHSLDRPYREIDELTNPVPPSLPRPYPVPDGVDSDPVLPVPTPPLRGSSGDGDGGAEPARNLPTPSSLAAVEDRACGRCFRPVPSNVLEALGGICGGCRAKAGEVGA